MRMRNRICDHLRQMGGLLDSIGGACQTECILGHTPSTTTQPFAMPIITLAAKHAIAAKVPLAAKLAANKTALVGVKGSAASIAPPHCPDGTVPYYSPFSPWNNPDICVPYNPFLFL